MTRFATADGILEIADRPTAASRIPSAAATTNATVAKASPGNLFTINWTNAAAAVRYLKIYDKATAPTVGTDVPVLTIALPVSLAGSVDFKGMEFAAGISYALTTGAADNNTGALTLADVLGLNVAFA